MNIKKIVLSMLALVIMDFRSNAETATVTPGNQYVPVETHLRVDIDKGTDNITFVTDNSDPDVVTKAYKLKHVAPYILRGYVVDAIGGSGGTLSNEGSGAKKIDENLTKVEAITYNDGTGVLVVSAEEYKFSKQPNGAVSIDELIEKLDIPGLKGSSGSSVVMYFPVARNADDLKSQLEQVGLLQNNQAEEVDRSRTVITVDTELNAVVMLTPRFKKKEILKMIGEYDRALPEAKITCTIYEIDIENDERVGNDFQAWQNGLGSDAFSVGVQSSYGWSGAGSSSSITGNKWQSTDFIQFSPQWTTQYLDFLEVSGRAKIVTTGEIEVLNDVTGTISRQTFTAFYEDDGALNESTVSTGPLTTAIAAGDVLGVTTDGDTITASTAIAIGEMVVTKLNRENSNSPILYSLKAVSGSDSFSQNGVDIGVSAEVYGFTDSLVSTFTDQYSIGKGTKHKTSVMQHDYNLSITPSIGTESTTLAIAVTNTSLIGNKSDGSPRTVESDIKTDVMISNQGKRFVIGGVTNSSVVKVTSKVPLLGDIPGIGWLFKTEHDAVKETKMIAVIECTLHAPNAPLSGGVLEAIGRVTGEITEPGK